MEYNILFTCAGKRNYLLRYFKEALKGRGKVIAVDSHKYAAASADADMFLQVPNIYDKNYIYKLRNIIADYNIVALISLNDLELSILSKNKDALEINNLKVLVSNTNIIDLAFDKWKTYQFFKGLGLNTPKTYINFDAALKAIKKNTLSFPIVLKPRFGSGSIGIDICEDMEELKLAHQLKKKQLKRLGYSLNGTMKVDDIIVIQEKINGREFGFDIVNNFDGEYFGTFLREKIEMRYGETDKAKSVINKKFNDFSIELANNLKHVGCLDGDVFFVENEWIFLELNARFGGGYPFSHEAGANIAAVYVDWIIGDNHNVSKHINYKEGLVFSKFDLLVRLSE
ncbi:carbamoyl-phosphate synthase large subunit [Hyunsoonleella jejuensis]|uniref:Carbamoyl-phosphate synthase large subunit n=1 Tax=Hyunsoonleella jejuensis TaxID=419940 RepID=A0A1H9GBH5_9FLAO|nr:ATP-grasp domain-containing protein [Hyunsoonleella jejuensis]SEQ47444.1 carbamoyl-phosphate synthase large subunit [Hyunsoonleella jejuensis]